MHYTDQILLSGQYINYRIYQYYENCGRILYTLKFLSLLIVLAYSIAVYTIKNLGKYRSRAKIVSGIRIRSVHNLRDLQMIKNLRLKPTCFFSTEAILNTESHPDVQLDNRWNKFSFLWLFLCSVFCIVRYLYLFTSLGCGSKSMNCGSGPTFPKNCRAGIRYLYCKCRTFFLSAKSSLSLT